MVILRHIFVQITFETGFYVLRQGDPEGRSSEGYASIKQAKTWLWHIEAIRGVVELVTNEELCKVVWGIIVKNFMQRERERHTDRRIETNRQTDRDRQTGRKERETETGTET